RVWRVPDPASDAQRPAHALDAAGVDLAEDRLAGLGRCAVGLEGAAPLDPAGVRALFGDRHGREVVADRDRALLDDRVGEAARGVVPGLEALHDLHAAGPGDAADRADALPLHGARLERGP